MGTVVVYYSLDGNTDVIAQKTAQKIGADIVRLIPKKKIPTGNFNKYFWGGMSVIFHQKPELTNGKIKMDNYDTIIVGSPVWAGSFASPISTFLAQNNISGKDIYLIACSDSGDAKGCINKFKKRLSGNNIKGAVDFVKPNKGMDKNAVQKLDQFCDAILIRANF